MVARTLRPQLRRRWKLCKIQRKAAPILGPGTWAPKGGRRSCSLFFLRTGQSSFLMRNAGTRQPRTSSLCALVPKSWPSADRGGPFRGSGFLHRLWTSFWGAESGSSFGRRQVACSLGLKGARTASRPAGWLVGWLVGLGGRELINWLSSRLWLGKALPRAECLKHDDFEALWAFEVVFVHDFHWFEVVCICSGLLCVVAFCLV